MMRPTRANKPNGYLLGSYRGASIPVSMMRTADSVLSIDVSFQMPFGLGGV